MRVLSWEDLVRLEKPETQPVRLTIGVFDGLHIGHRKLLEGVLQGPHDALPMVVTFRKSPALLFAPETFPGFLMSFGQKIALLDRFGIATAVVIDFSEEMSNLSGKAFIGLLKEKLRIEKIVVGHDFRFGKGRNAGTDDLKQMLSNTGTEVQVTEPVLWGQKIVSSSRIRKTIKDADFSEAKAMLAQPYSIDFRGIPVRREGGCLKVRRTDVVQVLPKDGTYDVACVTTAGRQPCRLVVGVDVTLSSAAEYGGDILEIVFA
jgi:riboflavin kinase/FMN adenylyltransferase